MIDTPLEKTSNVNARGISPEAILFGRSGFTIADLPIAKKSAVFIDDVERAERFPVVGPAMHEVVRPDMVAMLRP